MSRTVEDLEANAEKFWPTSLATREQSTSIIPRLIATQEKFIGILYVADASPDAWKSALQATTGMPGNLFLKHLVVLTDIGGEKLQRLRTNLKKIFPRGKMAYQWQGRQYTYTFKATSTADDWTNRQLGLDGRGLTDKIPIANAHEDVAMLLIHGGTSTDQGVPRDIKEKCLIGSLLGQKRELDSFVRQRYIHVSRITGGAAANQMGQLCQQYVRDRLNVALPGWDLRAKKIPGISQNAGKTDISFDIVAKSPSGKCCAIEISFQVTTNSTIERKAGQAEARHHLLHRHGHQIAYVIDGAGNLQRHAALATICANSDCTVTFAPAELGRLVEFLKQADATARGRR